VLVGGFGTRLRPLTLSTPKQMLPVAGRPMIERVLAHLAAHGIDDVVLSLGYRPDAFTDAYPDATCAGVRLHYAVEPEPLDTAGAIGFAARQAGVEDRFVVVNGDVLTDIDLTALLAFHDRVGAEGTIALTKVDDPSQFGVVPTDPDGRVLAFVEKPPRDEAPTDLVNAGFYVLEPSVLDRIPSGRKVNIERETFPAMVAGGTLYGQADPAYWLDVGTPERLLQANLDVLDGLRPSVAVDGAGAAGIAGTGTVEGSLVGADVAVEGTARVSRSVLGRGVRIADGATVEDAVLLPGASVGPGATVRRSLMGAGASVAGGASIDDLSILGDGARVESGCALRTASVPEPAR
jgi:mannose-1-phosphate guanylyltransferase